MAAEKNARKERNGYRGSSGALLTDAKKIARAPRHRGTACLGAFLSTEERRNGEREPGHAPPTMPTLSTTEFFLRLVMVPEGSGGKTEWFGTKEGRSGVPM